MHAVVPPDEVVLAQYRYHGPLVPGTWSEGGALFTPTTPLPEAVAAGQSLVLYRGDECVGGGIIS
jgi:tRNA U34 2-thiouridine synthase MnmA/TrmU